MGVAQRPKPTAGRLVCRKGGENDENMTKIRVLLGLLAVLVLVGSAVGCGLVSDRTKQEAKKRVESKAQQAEQEAKGKKAKQEIQKKVEELLKKVDAQEQQNQKENK